jgi:hypothetical protein
MDIQKLCKDQWLALAPVFKSSSGEIPQLDLHRNTLLPFTEDQELNPISVRGGGYGEVWAVGSIRAIRICCIPHIPK